MKALEKISIINNIPSMLEARLPPILGDAQLAAQITARITAAKPPPAPWNPPEICQYPSPPKMDDFSMTEGMGSVSLQGAIDALNNFKTSCKNTIKTKLEAIGPEASKDAKLAAGSTSLLKEVLEAARCFSKIVKNVNELVTAYITSIDITMVSIANQIALLQQQIEDLKQMMRKDLLSEALQLTIGALMDRLATTTDIFEMLALLMEIEKEINKANREVDTLLGSFDRLAMHLSASITDE